MGQVFPLLFPLRITPAYTRMNAYMKYKAADEKQMKENLKLSSLLLQEFFYLIQLFTVAGLKYIARLILSTQQTKVAKSKEI